MTNDKTRLKYESEVEKLDIYNHPEMPKIAFLALGLNGEAGEVAEKIKKLYRDKDGVSTFDSSHAIAVELGDTLWYLTRLANVIGYSLTDIMHINLTKLYDREKRNTRHGEGDVR